jgi:hypothetical protein
MFVGEVEGLRTNAAEQPLLYVDGGWASLVRASSLDLDRYRELVRLSLAAVDDALDVEGPPGVQLRRFAKEFALVNMTEVDVTRSFFSHESYAPTQELSEINALKREFDRKLRGLIGRGAEEGAFVLDDPQVAAMAIVGMMSWMHRWYRDQGRLKREEIADRFASLVESMVGGPPVLPPSFRVH